MSDEKTTIGSCIIEKNEGAATVILNRPEKMNALGPDLFDSLREAFTRVMEDDSVRAIVIAGEGDHFSAGGDVQEDIEPLQKMDVTEFRAYFEPLARLYRDVYQVDKPTIAAIQGFALGAGMELALMCDIRIAGETAQMGEFFVKMGLVPETGMCMLPRIVGPGMAKYLCFTGKLVPAEEALRIGLAEQVVPAAELRAEAEKLARKLARGPASVGIMKRAINEFSEMPLESTFNMATTYQYQASRTEDHKEAVCSFLEKRKPEFRGK